MDSPPVSTQQDTIDEIVKKSERVESLQIRRVFLQQGHGSQLKAGPLASFVHSHDPRALDLYLLTSTLARGEPFHAKLPAGAWARALGLSETSRRTAVSRSWKRLEELKLITRGREGRTAVVTLLREDGSGDRYARPDGSENDRYLALPLAYFRDGWYKHMDLATKAMLLIALDRPASFQLPAIRVPRWYGISTDTAERGFANLRSLGLLERKPHFMVAPLTDQGWTKDYTYRLKGSFAKRRRASIEKEGVKLEVV